MEPLQHAHDPAWMDHLLHADRVLGLPKEVTGFRWHPFGVYVLPLAKRTADGETWSRRLHVWHPGATPVGEASPYGVHTHSGLARSHVLVGSLHHHLYQFERDAEGIWVEAQGDPLARARLVAHVQATTDAGMVHTLPADQPHAVSKPPGIAVSLFEQRDGPVNQPFTTWQRTDVPAEELVRTPPVPLDEVLRDARLAVGQALVA